MFFKLILRNSRRSRKENGLFFASLLISVIAFYMILSLGRQDVMLFLAKMESDAVGRLFQIIPVFYVMTLFILFFLIYYASKFELERRRHEFGMYLMMGMRRIKLFTMLLAEDIGGTLLTLLLGIPVAVFLSECTSLITARLVGLGIIGHQITLSVSAVFWTAVGFLIIKTAAFFILSGKIAGQEIASLLTDTPEGAKKQKSPGVYKKALAVGFFCLFAAYFLAISGIAWYGLIPMGITLLLGSFGTVRLFFGMRMILDFFARRQKKNRQLAVFNFRQIQEIVICRSNTLAVSSLLILAAMCCFGTGTAIAGYYSESEPHVLDYTFRNEEMELPEIQHALQEHGIAEEFSELFEMKVGYIRTTEDYDHAFQMDSVMAALEKLPESKDRDVLLNNLQYTSYPYLIALSDYNCLRKAAGLSPIVLEEGEAAVYMDKEFANEKKQEMLNAVLKERPAAILDQNDCTLTGEIQTISLVTDRVITLSFALIVPDEVFYRYTKGEYSTYLNAVLQPDAVKESGLMRAIFAVNERLEQARIPFESYLQNMGRQLFYITAASYITIYLAIMFFIIANTMIGVQFLMGQRKSGRRYQTLIRLGATYQALCRSAAWQINWYFGIPAIVAAASSLFGVRALFTGLLPTQGGTEMLLISAGMVLALCVIEYIYIAAVRRQSSRYLLTLMVPTREE